MYWGTLFSEFSADAVDLRVEESCCLIWTHLVYHESYEIHLVKLVPTLQPVLWGTQE
jgi:hypothetical protein